MQIIALALLPCAFRRIHSDPQQWQLLSLSLSFKPFPDQAAQHSLFLSWDFLAALLGMAPLPWVYRALSAALAANQLAPLHSPFNAMHIFSIFWKGYCGAQQELTLLETYTLCKESGVMWQRRWEAEIICHWTTDFFPKCQVPKSKGSDNWREKLFLPPNSKAAAACWDRHGRLGAKPISPQPGWGAAPVGLCLVGSGGMVREIFHILGWRQRAQLWHCSSCKPDA